MKIGVMALVAGLAASAQAGTIVINTGAYSSGQGGEFNAQLSGFSFAPYGLTGGAWFETFCLEIPENFTPGTVYNVTIDTFADGGGNGGQVGPVDPLDERTAYLYSLFLSGGLVGYDYSNGLGQRQANAGALQNAIWYLENEVGSLDSAEALSYFNQSLAGIGQGLGLVRVANLTDNSGGKHQSMLITIPAPGALAGVLVAGVAAARRRR